MKEDKKENRPEAYPRPTQTDNQLQNQTEFIDQKPNDFHDKSISDLPANDAHDKVSNDPGEERK
jgi:hypothetical protein